jgi:RHS repeat-associated protein
LNGNIIENGYSYDSFGRLTSGEFDDFNRLGYNGKKIDPVLSVYDYGFRDYSPVAMRFTTVDPIKDSYNWYAYVGNDPINFIDPFGLSPSDNQGYQTPTDPTDWHCDINANNSLIDGGRDPLPPSGNAWDGNEEPVSEIVKQYDLSNDPEPGTGGYGFYDSPKDSDDVPEHMYRYEYSGGDTIDVWSSNGKDDVSHSVRPLDNSLITNSDFSAQDELDHNQPIQ